MENFEKAREISDIYMPDTGFNREDLYDAAMQMAQWKDEQLGKEKKELLGLVNMLPVDDHNQTIIEDLKALLQ